ncbi:hypothetical protein BC830DRAFT_1138021 [Chytriomyces sp. MP71]|nr:hypothetical protein BC830DRAFT_1138021 [Chytriomyces sp. MP71]
MSFSFGVPASTASTGGSLFGSANPAASSTQTSTLTQAPTTAPLFGAAAASAPATATTGTPSLFGAASTTNPTTNTTTANTPLFGSATAAITAQNTVANANAAPASGAVQGVAIENIARTTRYGELPQNVREELDNFEYVFAWDRTDGTANEGYRSDTMRETSGLRQEQPSWGESIGSLAKNDFSDTNAWTSRVNQQRGMGRVFGCTGKRKPFVSGPTVQSSDSALFYKFNRRFVQKQIDMSEDIASSGVVKKLHATHTSFKSMELKFQGLKTLLDRDTVLIQNLRNLVGREMKIADFATRFVESYQTHRQSSMTFNNTDSFQYFVNLTNTLESRLQSYRQTIDDLERHLLSISQKAQHSPQTIAEILQRQHESFLAIAGKVASAHDALQKQRDAYVTYRRTYFGDNKNPFKRGFVGQDEENLTPLSTIAAGLRPEAAVPAPAAAATGFSGFGTNTTAPAASTSLFGSTTAPAATTTTTGFGGFGPSAAPAGTSSLFGGAAAAPAANATVHAPGGGFGGFVQGAATPAAGGGLFGQSVSAGGAGFGFGAAPAAPATTGGFFNSPSVTTKKKR